MSIPKHEVVCGIYKITSPSGRIYIGQSIDIYKAWNNRYKNGHCKNQSKLYNSIKKYGWDAHKKEVIHQIDEYSIVELNTLEKYYEELYDSTHSKNGLNLRKGGGSKGKMSDQTRRRMSESKKGEKNYFFGKTHSEKTRNKISEGNAGEKSHMFGKRMSLENRNKLSESRKGEKNYMFGKIQSPETRKKISDFQKGKTWSLGKKASIETREKLSECKRGEKNHFFGKHHTEETKQKLSLKKSKLILNTKTGIVYYGYKEASKIAKLSITTLRKKLMGLTKNNTTFICVNS